MALNPYQQETQYTCAPASLKAVMSHWGLNVPEKVVGVRVRVHKRRGAETTQIVAAAKKFGFNAEEKSVSMEEARRLTQSGVPIICDIQSFTKPGSGHYVVLTYLDESKAALMDPNVKGNVRNLTAQEFEDRWWDRAMFPPHKMMKRWGVIVTPKDKIKEAAIQQRIPLQGGAKIVLRSKRKGTTYEIQVRKKQPRAVRMLKNMGGGMVGGAVTTSIASAALRKLTKGKKGLDFGTAAILGSISGGLGGLTKAGSENVKTAFAKELLRIWDK